MGVIEGGTWGLPARADDIHRAKEARVTQPPPGSRRPPDRRDSYRLEIAEGEAWIEAPDWPEATFRDLSASGGALLVQGTGSGGLAPRPATIHLSSACTFDAQVTPVRFGLAPGRVELGVRFDHLDRDAFRALSGYLIEAYLSQADAGRQSPSSLAVEVLDPAAIHAVLRHTAIGLGHFIAARPAPGLRTVLSIAHLPPPGTDEPIRARVVGGPAEALVESAEYRFRVSGNHVVYLFDTTVVGRDGKALLLRTPERLTRTGFRSSPRTTVGETDGVIVRLEHPRLTDRHVERSVLDISANGLALPLEPAVDLLVPGDRLPRVVVETPDGRVVGSAVLRSVGRALDVGGLRGGLEIVDFSSPRDAERWHCFVFRAAHPGVVLGHSQLIGDTWSVLEASGYLDEIGVSTTPAVRRRYFVAWQKHTRHSETGRYFLVRREGRSVGTLAISQLYPGTWLVHHLGIERDDTDAARESFFDVAREMYSANAFLLAHLACAERFVIYVDAAKSWNDLMYSRFLAAYPRKDEFLYDRFRLFRLRTDSAQNASTSSASIQLSEPSKTLRGEISRRLKGSLPAVEYAAYAYDEANIDLDEFGQRCTALGYERARFLKVAISDGEPVALLVGELGPPGLNLFGLLDACWVLPLRRGVDADPMVVQTLANAARDEYRARGRNAALFFDRRPLGVDTESVDGLELVADGLRWVASREILPAYLQYIDELLGSLASRTRHRRPAAVRAEGGERIR